MAWTLDVYSDVNATRTLRKTLISLTRCSTKDEAIPRAVASPGQFLKTPRGHFSKLKLVLQPQKPWTSLDKARVFLRGFLLRAVPRENGE